MSGTPPLPASPPFQEEKHMSFTSVAIGNEILIERAGGHKGRRGRESGYVPRNSLLPLSVPPLVVSGIVADCELRVGGVAAYGAVGHGGWGWVA